MGERLSMTIEEALHCMKDNKRCEDCDLYGKENDCFYEALNMATRSLEAWELVKAEIEELTFYWCEVNPRSVTEDCLKIIDKHLKGVFDE